MNDYAADLITTLSKLSAEVPAATERKERDTIKRLIDETLTELTLAILRMENQR